MHIRTYPLTNEGISDAISFLTNKDLRTITLIVGDIEIKKYDLLRVELILVMLCLEKNIDTYNINDNTIYIREDVSNTIRKLVI